MNKYDNPRQPSAEERTEPAIPTTAAELYKNPEYLPPLTPQSKELIEKFLQGLGDSSPTPDKVHAFIIEYENIAVTPLLSDLKKCASDPSPSITSKAKTYTHTEYSEKSDKNYRYTENYTGWYLRAGGVDFHIGNQFTNGRWYTAPDADPDILLENNTWADAVEAQRLLILGKTNALQNGLRVIQAIIQRHAVSGDWSRIEQLRQMIEEQCQGCTEQLKQNDPAIAELIAKKVQWFDGFTMRVHWWADMLIKNAEVVPEASRAAGDLQFSMKSFSSDVSILRDRVRYNSPGAVESMETFMETFWYNESFAHKIEHLWVKMRPTIQPTIRDMLWNEYNAMNEQFGNALNTDQHNKLHSIYYSLSILDKPVELYEVMRILNEIQKLERDLRRTSKTAKSQKQKANVIDVFSAGAEAPLVKPLPGDMRATLLEKMKTAQTLVQFAAAFVYEASQGGKLEKSAQFQTQMERLAERLDAVLAALQSENEVDETQAKSTVGDLAALAKQNADKVAKCFGGGSLAVEWPSRYRESKQFVPQAIEHIGETASDEQQHAIEKSIMKETLRLGRVLQPEEVEELVLQVVAA